MQDILVAAQLFSGCFSDGLDGCFSAVFSAFGASGAGSGGFRRSRGMDRCPADAAIVCPDSCGRQQCGSYRLLPRQSVVSCNRPSKAELGVGGDDQPGPSVSRCRAAQMWPCPPQGLFQKPEGVLQIKAAQEHGPPMIDFVVVIGDGFG